VRKKKAQTWKEFWDLLATSCDPIAATDRPTVSPETYQLYSAEIVRKLALGKDDVLLDIGCGTGLIDASLAVHVRMVFATDFSKVMTQKARSNTAICGNVHVVTCDCAAPPFKDGTFSKVVMYAVAQYLSRAQIGQMLEEAQRIIRPGGLIMLGEIPRDRDVKLLVRVRDVWIHQGLPGVLYKVFDVLLDRWLRFTGRLTHQFVRPEEPPITLHSAEKLLGLVRQLNMRGWVLPQSEKLPWFHQTFDLLIEAVPASDMRENPSL
jgi:ubiquinone/menaquinone biosynthesis C-methylase UbiE